MSVIFVKFETTGRNLAVDRIHKISAVACDLQLNVVGKFLGFANPGPPCRQWTISAEKLRARADKREIGDLLFRFRAFLEDLPQPRTLVSHTGNAFEFEMLEKELIYCGSCKEDWLQFDRIDTASIFMEFERQNSQGTDYGLDAVADRLADLPPRQGSHESYGDAAVLYFCCKKIKQFFLSRFDDHKMPF